MTPDVGSPRHQRPLPPGIHAPVPVHAVRRYQGMPVPSAPRDAQVEEEEEEEEEGEGEGEGEENHSLEGNSYALDPGQERTLEQLLFPSMNRVRYARTNLSRADECVATVLGDGSIRFMVQVRDPVFRHFTNVVFQEKRQPKRFAQQQSSPPPLQEEAPSPDPPRKRSRVESSGPRRQRKGRSSRAGSARLALRIEDVGEGVVGRSPLSFVCSAADSVPSLPQSANSTVEAE